jgi:transposase
MVKTARMIKRHLDNLLTCFRHPVTNAKSEAFDSRVQWLKSAARGFRLFANYRIRIPFYCGRLDMKPAGCH